MVKNKAPARLCCIFLVWSLSLSLPSRLGPIKAGPTCLSPTPLILRVPLDPAGAGPRQSHKTVTLHGITNSKAPCYPQLLSDLPANQRFPLKHLLEQLTQLRKHLYLPYYCIIKDMIGYTGEEVHGAMSEGS